MTRTRPFDAIASPGSPLDGRCRVLADVKASAPLVSASRVPGVVYDNDPALAYRTNRVIKELDRAKRQ